MKSFGDTLPAFMSAFIADPAALIGALFLPIIVGCLIGTIAWFAGFEFTYWADGWRGTAAKLAAARLRRAGLGPNDNLADAVVGDRDGSERAPGND